MIFFLPEWYHIMYRNRMSSKNSGGDDSAMMIVLLIVVVLIIAGFAWWYVNSQKQAPAPAVVIVEQPTASTVTAPSPGSSSGGGAFRGPLDFVGGYRTEALGAYSVRHVYSEYDGPVLRARRVEGSGAGQEDDFFQKEKNGDLTSGGGKTLGEFLGAGSGGVVTIWYDQSKNNRHITMRSGFPKIKSDTGLKGDGQYRLEFNNTKMSFDDDGTKDTSISLANYSNLTIISNDNIFVGPMQNRVMRGVLTDVFFFKSRAGGGAVEVLQMSKYPLREINPRTDVSDSSKSRIIVAPDTGDITVINNTKGLIGVYVKTPAGTKKVIREKIPGNGMTTMIQKSPEVMPGATLYLATALNAAVIADVTIPMSVTKGRIDGDLSAKKLYVKDLQPWTAVVNIYEVRADGGVNPTPIHSNIKQNDSNKSFPVASMKKGSKYIIGPLPTAEISRWTAT
jgi:hypothetical protein